MFSAHFALVEQENHNAQPYNVLELLRIPPSSQRSAFLTGSLPTFAKTESGWLTPPAGLNRCINDVTKVGHHRGTNVTTLSRGGTGKKLVANEYNDQVLAAHKVLF